MTISENTSPAGGRPVEEEAKRERNRSDVTRARVEERRKGAKSPKTRSRSTKTQINLFSKDRGELLPIRPRLHGRKLPAICRNETALYPFTRRPGKMPARNAEGLGIRDDPVLHERDQAIEIFKETVEFEKGRYIVQLPFRKSCNELSDNYPLAKQRFQNLWRRFGHDSELYQQYREIIRDYTEQGIIEEVKTEITDNKLKRPVYYLPHQAKRKDGRLTSKRRIVFDAGSHQNNELSLNDLFMARN
ncbi:DUF1758 domain-containing protein [Trichonephila clavipes]|nr:DUF1758 domain-containing protein [Trichonephila clavipes]